MTYINGFWSIRLNLSTDYSSIHFLLLSTVLSLINTREPVPLAAIRDHAIRRGEQFVLSNMPFFSHHSSLPSFYFVSFIHPEVFLANSWIQSFAFTMVRFSLNYWLWHKYSWSFLKGREFFCHHTTLSGIFFGFPGIFGGVFWCSPWYQIIDSHLIHPPPSLSNGVVGIFLHIESEQQQIPNKNGLNSRFYLTE